MSEPSIDRGVMLTEEQLARNRASLVQAYAAQGYLVTEFTCDKCAARYRCTLAFDLYNTDGDCLAEK
jgi:hypothetical protein